MSYNTCEYFTTWNWNVGICNLITMPDMVWSQIFDKVTPRLKCPLEKVRQANDKTPVLQCRFSNMSFSRQAEEDHLF